MRAVIAVALFWPAAAFADPPPPDLTPFHAQARRWGHAEHVVAPKYPEAALAAGRTAELDFFGTVTPTGELAEMRFAPASAADEDFVASLRKVLPAWRFHPAIDKRCSPSTERLAWRAHFALRDGQPHFAVTHQPASLARELREDERVVHRIVPRYPRRAVLDQVEAHVYARMEIDKAGQVAAVGALAYPRDHRDAEHFEHAVAKALYEWRYPEALPDRVAPRIACQSFHFRVAP